MRQMLAIWFLLPLPFLNLACSSGISQFTFCCSLAGRTLSITLLACEISAIMQYFEHSLALPFFAIGMKTDIFQPCGHCWGFQICWHIECSTFTASSFIWNSSAEIPSLPLALFMVMISKAHLTSHSKMSDSRWVISPSWLFGSWRSFLYSSSVYSCHLFLISSASVRSIAFLSSIESIFACSLGISNFLEEISSLSYSIVFLYFFTFVHLKRLSYLSMLFLELCIQMGVSFLSPLPFASLFSAIHKTSSDNHFPFFIYFFGGMV